MRALFLGAPVAPPAECLPWVERFEATGLNTGNLAIGQSLLKQLRVTEYVAAPRPEQLDFSAEEADERFDVIIIPAANFLFWRFDFSAYAEFIERTGLPCIMIGLGAQAPRPDRFDWNIPAGTLRLLEIVSERSRSIGVRGEFSADVMASLGFQNVQVIGCPSVYRTLKREIAISFKEDGSPMRVLLNGSRNVYSHSGAPENMKSVEAAMLKLSLGTESTYILQNERPEIDICLSTTEPSDQVLAEAVSIIESFDLHISPHRFVDHVRKNCRVFFDIDEWTQFIKEFSFSVGSRLHSHILALTSGVPSILFAHDTRTAEVAELFEMPQVPIDTLLGVDVEALYAMVSFEKFMARYRTMFARYEDFLNDNGLPHRLEMESLVP